MLCEVKDGFVAKRRVNMSNNNYGGVNYSYRFGQPNNVQTDEQPAVSQHSIIAENRLDAAIHSVDETQRKRNTLVEVKDLVKTSHSLIWDRLDQLVIETISEFGDDPVFYEALRSFAVNYCGVSSDRPATDAVLDLWHICADAQYRVSAMRRKAIILELVQQQLSKV